MVFFNSQHSLKGQYRSSYHDSLVSQAKRCVSLILVTSARNIHVPFVSLRTKHWCELQVRLAKHFRKPFLQQLRVLQLL